MLQWLKRSLASFLGDKKDIVKNFPIIKSLNKKANIELDTKRSELLSDNFVEILDVVYSSKLKDYSLWLDFGTLLGYYRENDFISHDLDMDFGILIPNLEEFYKIEKTLLQKGLAKTKEFYYDEKLVELSYDYKGLNVDFIVYERQGNSLNSKTIFYMKNSLGKPTRLEVYDYSLPFSELKKVDFKGIDIKVPDNAKEYLSALYGKDFEIPNTNYNWKGNPIYKKIDANNASVVLKNRK
ncbi:MULTISPECIES: LicD family protein [Gemella]|uniref:LicD family protein n=1 Tax=Gemella TaxID=1378 RepID=UPI0007683B8A|nr:MULTISPECIES: LicD family protein [Gemella]AME08891.1 phosphate ABC transporter permease [Gemella sp. oral taxon 928]AXI26462.1 phosphate ABC transporter permease [Gemella sp. ND 6198]